MKKRVLKQVVVWVLLLSGSGSQAPAAPHPWWDAFPRVISTSDLAEAQAYNASAALNGVGTDAGWGLWFTYANDSGAWAASTRQNFQAAGICSLSYNESYGDSSAPIVELQWNAASQRWTTPYFFWSWQLYSGGPIAWSGAWSWFDSFLNDSPTNQSEASYFARPFTRLNPVYGGPPMTYPDGTIATGFLNNNSSDPSKSRVYDAGASKDIFGRLQPWYDYNGSASATNQPHAGEIWVAASGKFSGDVVLNKDSACPLWVDYARASTLAAAQLTGAQGTWTDNFGAWDSFMNGGPVNSAFGEWSVARFRNYLTNHFALGQLQDWGVLATNSTLADIAAFDVRAYFRTVASNQFGLASSTLGDGAWYNSDWLVQPVWRAYKIFKRQTGTAALSAYDEAVHSAAAQGGQTNFAFLVNDITPACFGWARGSFDLASTELSLGWNLASGPRGFGLPPFARVGPFYKAAREHGHSRFVTVWLYNDAYPTALTNRGPVEALFYEMLATDTLPMLAAGDPRWAGTPSVQTNFLRFVAQSAAPALADRVAVEEVGVYFSSSSILAVALPGDPSNFTSQDHMFALWGWGTALSELHYQYRIVPEWKLTRDLLRTLKVLIIPNSMVFEPADATILQTWVQSDGGSLIVTGDSGSRLGESGNFEAVTNLVLSPLTSVTDYNSAPSVSTNRLGAGVVVYVKNNLGRNYFDADTAGRAAQRPSLAQVLSEGFGLLGAQPVLVSTNAPCTVGLTLYADVAGARTLLDLNNFDVDASSFVTTPTPPVDVVLPKPTWLTNGVQVLARALSPDGAISVAAPDVGTNQVHLRLPSVTNYLSLILEPAPVRPSIAAQPTNQTVLAGTAVRMAVGATGSEPLSYQWQFNGTNLSGATSSVLALAAAARTNGGIYAVQLTNLYGHVLSSNATLTVLVPLQLQSAAVLPDGTFRLTSINADGYPIPADQVVNYEARATTNLVYWVTLSNALTWSNATLLLNDTDAANYPRRFYRVNQQGTP